MQKIFNFVEAQILVSFLITSGKSFSFVAISDDEFKIDIVDEEDFNIDEKLESYAIFSEENLSKAVTQIASKIGGEINSQGRNLQICFLALHGLTPDNIKENLGIGERLVH